MHILEEIRFRLPYMSKCIKLRLNEILNGNLTEGVHDVDLARYISLYINIRG